MDTNDKDLFQEMDRVRREDPLLDFVMRNFEQADTIYREALRAMGEVPENIESSSSSADLVWSFSPDE